MRTELSIYYIGKDTKYFDKIKVQFQQTYSEIENRFKIIEVIDHEHVKDIFIDIYNNRPDIVFIDCSYGGDEELRLAKLINRNNELRLLSVVGLFDYNASKEMLKNAINSSIRIMHYKGIDTHGLTYDPISFLDVNLAKDPEFVQGKKVEDITIWQPLRVSYIENNYFHIETDSYLNVGDIIELDSHPLEDIMPSKKVYVAKFYDKNLYYNRRFAYDLEFIYIDNDFFTSSNKNWLLYKELKANPSKLAALNPIDEADILADMDERKKCFAPIRSKIDNWLASRVDQIVPKKLKVMVYDASLSVFKELDGEPFKFHYALNLQTKVMPEAYQVQRTMPHLIAFSFDEINNWDAIRRILKTIDSIEDYDPPIIVFGISESELEAQNIKYHRLMSYKHPIRVKEIEKLAKIIDEKVFVSNAKSKVFTTSKDSTSILSMKRVVDIVAMTESIAYFKSDVEIPMWTVFHLEKPVKMVFTVIPHKESGEFAKEKGVYRALINGINEAEKAKLRQMINKSLADKAEPEA